MKNQRVTKLVVSGLLIAIGMVIPMFSPLKIVLEPASFTLGSHVAVFIAMFISPAMAVVVAAGTAIGFYFGGFPIIIVLRAATHITYALVGALYLHRAADGNLSAIRLRLFSVCVGFIHAMGELIVVSAFYFGGSIGSAYQEKGFITSVLLLVGLGTVIHSMVDFEIARIIVLPLKKSMNSNLPII